MMNKAIPSAFRTVELNGGESVGSRREYPYHAVATTSPWEKKKTARRRIIAVKLSSWAREATS